MLSTGQLIKQKRKELGLSMEELGKKVGVSKVSIKKWEDGDVEKISTQYIKKLSEILNVSPIELLAYNFDNDLEFNITRIPIIGSIACGEPILSDDNITGYLDFPTSSLPKGDVFAMQTKGDSMTPTIPEGAKVVIRQQPTVENGEIAAVNVNGELTLKRVKKADDTILLIADNPAYDPIILKEDSSNYILGKAVDVSYSL